jgi:hypothetical protein
MRLACTWKLDPIREQRKRMVAVATILTMVRKVDQS